MRAAIAARGLDGFLIPRADEHLGEYVPESAERLAFITGFTGSAGLAIVLADRAAVWSDGRYTLQLEQQTDGALWERLHLIEEKPEEWLARHAAGLRIGYDPWLISADGLARFAGTEMVPVASNPLDEIWTDRPAPPMAPAVPHAEAFTGESSADKRARLGETLREAGQDAAVLSDPASLAWLFNIRGADVEFCPIALGYALLNADGTASLFMARRKTAAADTRASGRCGDAGRARCAACRAGGAERARPCATIRRPCRSGSKRSLEQAGAKIAEGADPVALPRATQKCGGAGGRARRASARRRGDGAVSGLVREGGAAGRETEISAAERLLAERARERNFKGESFPAISGAGEHGAIIHYRVSAESNRAIKPNEVYLIDSGGAVSGWHDRYHAHDLDRARMRRRMPCASM